MSATNNLRWKRIALLMLLCVANGTIDVFAQRGLTDIPDVDPKVERDTFVMSEGLSANLFAGDRDIAKPIQMNFDARGRLWVAGSETYPQIKPGQASNDKILVLEDTDHDGVIDKKTVFADGLLIPTGVLPDEKGGCYVANSTELIYLADDDGDGVSDRREIVLSGFGTEDTHHLLHTLRWAPDGSLFMNQSIYIHSHIETPTGVKHMNGGGLWRFRPDTLQLETFCLGFVNPWGTAFDQWGQTFVTDGAYGEGINHAFPDSVWVTSPGATRIMKGLNPGSPKHCSLEIISGGHFPADWQGNMITNDFRANRVCRFIVTDDGNQFSSRQATEVIRSTHVAFRPIDAKMGPDGALYIADWYNPIIQHGEVDFRDPRRDHVHGRIWRVSMEGRPLVNRPDLTTMNATGLLEQLRVPEESTRLWAKRMLRTRPKDEVLAALKTATTASLKATASQSESQYQLELLWAGLNIDHLDRQLLDRVLHAEQGQARAAALRICSDYLRQTDPDFVLQQCHRLVVDPSAHARLEAVTVLGRLNTVAATEAALLALDHPANFSLEFALWNTLRSTSGQWLPAVEAGTFDFGGNYSKLITALSAAKSGDAVSPILNMLEKKQIQGTEVYLVLKEAAQLANPNQMGQLAHWIDQHSAGTAEKIARWSMLAGTGRETPDPLPAGLLKIIQTDEGSIDTEVLQGAITLAGSWKLTEAYPRVKKMLDAVVKDEEKEAEPLIAALVSLAASNDELKNDAAQTLLNIITSESADTAIKAEAASKLSTIDLKSGAESIGALAVAWSPEAATSSLMKDILAQKNGQDQLAIQFANLKLQPDVARQLIANVRSSAQPSDRLIEVLRAAGNLDEQGWKFNETQLGEFLTEVQDNGDPFAGQLIYRRDNLQCTKCHAIGGVGSEVGPDMISIGASAPVDYLVQSLLDPNSKVKEGYHSKLIQTVEGKIISGIVTRQADGKVELRLADNSMIELAEDDIDQMADGKSLMPEGLVDTLTRTELRDLVCFLSKLGKEAPFAIRGEPVVRAWQVLPYNNAANSRLNRTSFDTVAAGEPEFVWQDTLPLVSGEMPLEGLATYKIHANVPKTTFLRTAIDVGASGKVRLSLGSAKGVQAWLDQDPALIKDPMDVELEAGRHWLYFAVDRESGPASLKLTATASEGSSATVTLPLKLK